MTCPSETPAGPGLTPGFDRRLKEASNIALIASGTLTAAYEEWSTPAEDERALREQIIRARNMASLAAARCNSLLTELDQLRRPGTPR